MNEDRMKTFGRDQKPGQNPNEARSDTKIERRAKRLKELYVYRLCAYSSQVRFL